MKKEDHLKVDKFFWNEEYPEVHQWLDEFYPKYKNNPYRHWLHRHHKEAIAEKYGHYTLKYNVACVHVLIDLLGIGVAEIPDSAESLEVLLKSMQYL